MESEASDQEAKDDIQEKMHNKTVESSYGQFQRSKALSKIPLIGLALRTLE